MKGYLGCAILIALLTGCEHYKPSPETVGELADPLRALISIRDSLGKISRRIHESCFFTATGSGVHETCPNKIGVIARVRYQETPIPEMDANDSFAHVDLNPDSRVYWDSSPAGITAAKLFATGWYVLAQPRTFTDPATDNIFLDAVTRYRAEPQPHMETLRRVQVQVESAIKTHNTIAAATLYRDALRNAPGWPDGHFNLALLYGELEFYAEAVNAMKKYLYLVPNAPDARAAQDKIYEWELKARQY